MADFTINDDGSFEYSTQSRTRTRTRKKQKEEKWYDEYFKESQGNGWQTFGYSALDALGNLTEGSLRAFEGISDWGRNRGADIVDFFGADEYAKELRERSKQDDTADIVKQWNHITAGDISGTKSEEEIGHFKKVEENSIFGDKSDQVFQGVGNSLTSVGVGALSGGTLATPSFVLSAAGNAETEALNDGATAGEARMYGLISGAIEYGTERLFGGLGKTSEKFGLGKGALDDQAVKLFTKNMKNSLMKNITTLGIKSVGEGLEEVASGIGNAFAQKITYMNEEEIGQLLKDQNLMDSFVSGMLSSALMQSPSTITSTVQGRDVNTGLTRTQQQYVNEIAQQRMVEAQRRNAKLNGYEKGKIEDRALTDFQKGRLANASKLQQVNLPGLSNKDMDLQQSAYKYGINPNSEFVVTAKTMLDNRGIKSRFDADAFKGSNENSYWTKKADGTREVVFNPNASADVLLEEIAIHELTHDLMSSENSQEVIDNQKIMDYVSTLDGYKEERAKVEKLYAEQTKKLKTKEEKTAYIDEEIVADTLGKNIGSQEYIRRLIDDEPSIAKNIYDWVVNKVANKNGVKNEKAYWNNVKNNFEKAYNMEYQGKGSKGNAKYSISMSKQLENQANEVAKKEIAERQAMIELFEDYLSENDITNPTEQDIYNSLDAYDVYDANESFDQEGQKKYFDTIKKYLKEQNQDTRYSLSDNQGRKLSEEQQEYFKNSKVRDENGNLLTVYHASSVQFGEFKGSNIPIYKDGKYVGKESNGLSYFTPDKQYIDGIKKSIKDGDLLNMPFEKQFEKSKPIVYETYLNIKNPLDLTRYNQENTPREWQSILKENGIDLSDQEIGDYAIIGVKFDAKQWDFDCQFFEMIKFATKDFTEKLKNAGFDGIKYYERLIENNVDSALGYITTSPNQIKRVDNLNPTDDADIRYSLSDKGTLQDSNGNEVTLDANETGKTGTLMAIHNLNEQKLKGILELGGFPVPSIAVTNNYTSNANFGEISVLFDKNTIDPELNKANKVYSRDAYTTRIPKIANKINESGLQQVSQNTGLETWDLKDRFRETTLDEAVDNIRRNENILDKYLEQKGIKVEPIYRDFRGLTSLSQQALQRFINEHQDLLNMDYTNRMSYSTYEKYYKDVHDLFVDEAVEKTNGKATREQAEKLYGEYPGFNHWDFFLRDLTAVQELEGRQQLDEYATKNAKEKAVDINSKEYNDFVRDLISPMFGDKYVRNNKDYYTASGNPRSFDQRYEAFTLENIVKIMNENKGTGQEGGFFTGIGELAGDSSKRFTSIEDIKSNEHLLETQNREEYQAVLDKYSEEMRDINSDILQQYGDLDTDSYIWRDKSISETMKSIARKVADGKKVNIKSVISQFDKNYIKVNEEQAQRTLDLINNIANLPTDYFEAKPQRAVGLDEVQAIVIPNTTSAEFKQQLQDAGLKYYEYDPNIEGDRQRVINQFEDLKFSKQNEDWQSFLDNNFESKGTKTRLSDIKLPGITNTVQEEVQTEVQKSLLPIANELKELNKNLNKVLNPNEISQLTPQDANTTPILPGINRNQVGDGRSSFFDNINNKVGMLNDEQKAAILSSNDVKYYDKVTNKDSLDKAFERLQNGGANEVLRWHKLANRDENGQPIHSISATDIAEGWILLKQYADNGDTENMVEVAKTLRNMGTMAGQTVQAFNILSRLTPEGMVKYAQSELLEAYDQMVKNKSKAWIDANRDKFELKPNEVQFIMDTMKEVSTMEDGYDKRVKLAEIQKLMTDKLPPTKGAGLKAWMRISMLFNPKTQIRNIAGNAVIAPVNYFGDLFASGVDKLISKKTGVRTTGTTKLSNYAKGFKTGLYQSYNDFKKGINTRNIEGNRFEIGEGRSFNDNTGVGKTLNRVDSLLSFMLDAGDRGFYEAAFTNSINNQMVLNNTTEVTQEMIDIATQEALSRTWQDNNTYSKAVLGIRKLLNLGQTYGIGDVLIPFAKTPANLTKAIVDYSPAGLVNVLVKGNNLRKSLNNGQFNAKMQHEFVQSLGKATAGTMLYVLGYALAQAGITSGASDEDKDVSNFMKNTLGVNSYSIKIGDVSFTYDWAQPIAAPLTITANVVNAQKEDKEQALTEAIIGSLDSAGSTLLEQSFLQSINDVLNNQDGVVSGLITEMLELPARAIPTLSKQIVDLTDSTQRQTFEYNKPIKSAYNYAISKIPVLSYTLNPSVDTMGREIQKYGGKNNLFNVFLNPANVSTENVSESAQEIYRLYKETGETNIMPRVAPYYVNKKGEKIILTTQQRTQYQKVSGAIIEENVANLLGSTAYKNMSDTKKAETINDIVNYSYNIAQNQVLGTELSDTYETAYEYAQIGDISDFYEFRNSIDDTNADTKRTSIVDYLYNSDLEDNQIANLYGNYYSSDKTINAMLELRIPMREFIKFNSADIQGQYNTSTGQTISGSKKNATIEYVNTLNLSKAQRAILVKSVYSSYKNNDNDIVRYVNTLPGTANEKKVWLKSIGFDAYDDDVFNYINSQNISKEEKIKKLKELGFTVRDGRVYY